MSDTNVPPAFRFDVPQEMHEVPLGIKEDGTELTDEKTLDDEMREFSRAYWGDEAEREPLRQLMAAMEAANAEQLRESGAVYHAAGVFPIGGSADGSRRPERISRCTLVISVRELENPAPQLAAAGIAEYLEHANDGGEVQQIDLPAGPAVVHLAAQRMVWNLEQRSSEGEEGGELEHFSLRIEVWIPFPDQDRVLLFCLSTTDSQDLYLYQGVLADIAESITFGAEYAVNSQLTHDVADTGWQNDFG